MRLMHIEIKSRKIFDIVRENIQEASNKQQQYGPKVKIREYEPGEMVLREYPPLANTKLGPKYIGPYIVIQMKGSHNVEIVKDGSPKIVHVSCLKPWNEQLLSYNYTVSGEVEEE